MKIVLFGLTLQLILTFLAPTAISEQNNANSYDCQSHSMVKNTEGRCVPTIELEGDLKKIFAITECHFMSGLTCKISYDGRLPLPSEIFFTELDETGKALGKNTRLIYPKLKAGETGFATFRIHSSSPSVITLTGKWEGQYKDPY